jgi:DNA-3-methyladenine glycosylase I
MVQKTKSIPETRCAWAGDDPLYHRYHDNEWGVPIHNDKKLFEFLVLEGMQAGLSWITVLKKRQAFREAFDGFDFNAVAEYKQGKINSLLKNPCIIRNRMKVNSAVTNARAFLKVRNEFGKFNSYIWSFVDDKPIQNSWESIKELPAKTQISEEISRDLKKRGFSFVGPTIVYAYMQAIGMVNDHTKDCFRYRKIKALLD